MLQCAVATSSIHFNERVRISKCYDRSMLELFKHTTFNDEKICDKINKDEKKTCCYKKKEILILHFLKYLLQENVMKKK